MSTLRSASVQAALTLGLATLTVALLALACAPLLLLRLG